MRCSELRAVRLCVYAVNLRCLADGFALRCWATDAHHAVCEECLHQFWMLCDNVSNDCVLCNSHVCNSLLKYIYLFIEFKIPLISV